MGKSLAQLIIYSRNVWIIDQITQVCFSFRVILWDPYVDNLHKVLTAIESSAIKLS